MALNYSLPASKEIASSAVNLPVTEGIIVVAVLALAAIVIIFVLRKYIVNSILGVILLIGLNALGVKISISVLTVIICAILGLFGVALLVALNLLGFNI